MIDREIADYIKQIESENGVLYPKILYGLTAKNMDKAIAFMQCGKVGAFYTATSYAIGTSALHQCSIDRIYGIKQRDSQKPLSILADKGSCGTWGLTDNHEQAIAAIIQKYWPGPVSLAKSHRRHIGKLIGRRADCQSNCFDRTIQRKAGFLPDRIGQQV